VYFLLTDRFFLLSKDFKLFALANAECLMAECKLYYFFNLSWRQLYVEAISEALLFFPAISQARSHISFVFPVPGAEYFPGCYFSRLPSSLEESYLNIKQFD